MSSETTISSLRQMISRAMADFGYSSEDLGQPQILVPDPKFGDYATNVALSLAKTLKTNPADLASRLSKALRSQDQDGAFADISATGGFVNFRLGAGWLGRFVFQSLSGMRVERLAQPGEKVLFEYSSPNTNKPLHIGHARNDTYGLACVRLLRAVGYEVVTCEVINDRGIHIMKSMLMYQKFGNGMTPSEAGMKPDHFVGKYYAMFGQQAAESPQREQALMGEAQDLLRRWEAGDEAVRKLWQTMNGWWQEGVRSTYEREGASFDQVDYESRIYDKGRELVLEGVRQGVFTREEDGSVSVDLTAEGLDKKYLLRNDGTTIYITQDMYLWHQRMLLHKPDMAVVTTSAEQSYHFSVLKKLFFKLGYPWAESFRHLPYEHVYLGQGKMSSRAGNAISADELADLIKARVKTVMAGLEKAKQSADNDALAEQVAWGAIKYGYLKYEPNTRIYFDIEQTIALEGNTGPYIQYAHSRIQSILRKAGSVNYAAPESLNSPEELALMRHLLHYSDTVVQAAKEFKPNLLSAYLYDLAAKFGTFYNAVPVLNAEREELKSQRLALLAAVATALKDGLAILGIEAPQEM